MTQVQTEPPATTARPRRRGLAVAAVLVAVLLVAWGGWRQVRASYSSAFLSATWVPAPAGRVAGRLLTWNGRPEVDQVIHVTDDANTTRSATTDGDGRFEVAGVGRLVRVDVEGIDAVELSRLNLRGPGGATVEIHLKRPPPPPRGPL